ILTPIKKRFCLGLRKRSYFAMVRKAKNLAAPRGFKGTTNRRGVHACLKARPFPGLCLDHGLAFTVPPLAECPPVAKPPRNAALHFAKQLAGRTPVGLRKVIRQIPANAQNSATQTEVARQRYNLAVAGNGLNITLRFRP